MFKRLILNDNNFLLVKKGIISKYGTRAEDLLKPRKRQQVGTWSVLGDLPT